MARLLHELIVESADTAASAEALRCHDASLTYGEIASQIEATARGLVASGIGRHERIAIYLDKRFESVIAMFAAAAAGAVFVPINPLLKTNQVIYILRDCNVRLLVTSPERLNALKERLFECHDLHTVVLTANAVQDSPIPRLTIRSWLALQDADNANLHRSIDSDMAAILYTSGSTGRPKGVVLSHCNMVTGADSVARYLKNTTHDRLLAILPFSFDYGLNQLTTAFLRGACVSLLNYLVPRDVLLACVREEITGLAGVPPLWIQLAALDWPTTISEHLRYVTNSGGIMPVNVTRMLRQKLPRTQVFLMYGLTEAFRSTFLPPEELDRRPDSIGKAVPNADIIVVRPDGTRCTKGESGELVHRGALVAMGYWNDPLATTERFRPDPLQTPEVPVPKLAVWSGDTVRMDDEGFLYFVGRQDDMIKTSGFRVSPTEIEEVIYAAGLVGEAVALGIDHPVLGQAIVVARTRVHERDATDEQLLDACKHHLPSFMVPLRFITCDALPLNVNGKIDRKQIASKLKDLFQEN